jgi:hypothetical protein
LPDGRLVGDVDFEGVRRKASHITPVPGGVGPMTVTMVPVNTISRTRRCTAGQFAARHLDSRTSRRLKSSSVWGDTALFGSAPNEAKSVARRSLRNSIRRPFLQTGYDGGCPAPDSRRASLCARGHSGWYAMWYPTVGLTPRSSPRGEPRHSRLLSWTNSVQRLFPAMPGSFLKHTRDCTFTRITFGIQITFGCTCVAAARQRLKQTPDSIMQ